MMKDVVENAVWTKTQALIQDKYGKRIAFKTIDLTNSAMPSFLEGDDLIVPLNSKAVYLGEVIVNRGSLLSSQQREEIVDLIKFLVEPHVYNKHLKLKEEIEAYKRQTAMEAVNFEDTEDSNVFSLFNDEAEETLLVKLINSVIHLRSSSGLIRKKVAVKIHDMAEQNLFVAFSEIARQMHSVEEFKTFDKTTFFIEDIAQLNAQELALLDAACALKLEGLVFIIGSSLNDKQIDALQVSNELRADMNAILFDIDRLPFAQQTSTDVLELLFFSSSNMSTQN
ncbi:MAG: hypothetical protein V4654_07240 [Bdellovibrionota bacterium]